MTTGVTPYGFLYYATLAYPLANRPSPVVVHQVMHPEVEWLECNADCVAAATVMQRVRSYTRGVPTSDNLRFSDAWAPYP